MEDRRAHERLDKVDIFIHQHSEDIQRIEESLIANTTLTKQIEANTAEIVEMMRGAKGIFFLLTLLVKVGVVLTAIYGFWQAFVHFIRG